LDLSRREILRFAQNDTKTGFFRSLFSRAVKCKEPMRVSPLAGSKSSYRTDLRAAIADLKEVQP
jgi:hypothetical protein